MPEKPLMNTIAGTFKRCKEENIGISRHHLRYLCTEGIIPTCMIGKKYLINWNVLMSYINGSMPEQKQDTQRGVIRRISN